MIEDKKRITSYHPILFKMKIEIFGLKFKHKIVDYRQREVFYMIDGIMIKFKTYNEAYFYCKENLIDIQE